MGIKRQLCDELEVMKAADTVHTVRRESPKTRHNVCHSGLTFTRTGKQK